MKINIVKVTDEEGYQFLIDEKDVSYLWKGCTVDYNPLYTSLELAQYLDDELENDNYHSLVGLAEFLANTLNDIVGKEKSLIILQKIAERGWYS